jgi:hypothetical protein
VDGSKISNKNQISKSKYCKLIINICRSLRLWKINNSLEARFIIRGIKNDLLKLMEKIVDEILQIH